MNLVSDSVSNLQLTFKDDIYTKANNLSPFDTNKRTKLIAAVFRELMNKITDLEPGIKLLFQQGSARCFNNQSQFLRKVVLKCLWLSVNPSIRDIFSKSDIEKMDNPLYLSIYKKVFDILLQFECYYTILWFFFQVPNFINYDIDGYRNVYEEMINYAISKDWNYKWKCKDFIKTTKGSTFYYNLVYHGKSNKILISKWNVLLNKIIDIPTKKEKILSIQKKSVSKKIKICFISDKLQNYTSVFRDRIGIISLLNPEKFDVSIAIYESSLLNETNLKYPNTFHPVIYHYLRKFIENDKIILLNKLEYENNITKLIGKFHIIFYPDLGMKQNQTLLAATKRLAPIQITTWGHSDTSGSKYIDYYITSKYFEIINKPDVIRNNFSEKTVILPSLGTYYYNPLKIAANFFKMSNPLYDIKEDTYKIDNDKINSSEIIIGSLQSFYKFNEEYENVILEIMNKLTLKNIKFKLLLSNSIPFNKIHLDRIKTKFKNFNEKITWFSNLSQDKWLNLMAKCHIVLDPFPFGGCNTTLEAFSLNIPVISLPSNTISGRFTYGFYKKMGILNDIAKPYCIGTNNTEYINKTVELCVNKGLYYKVIKNIFLNKNRLFEETKSVIDYENMLQMLYDKNVNMEK